MDSLDESPILIAVIAVVLVVGGLFAAYTILDSGIEPVPAPEPSPCPGPGPCPVPKPTPKPKPCPGPRPCPHFDATVSGEVLSDGTVIECCLPGEFHTKNVGGSDGAGLCVFCSMRHGGIWHDDPLFTGIFDWMKKHPGGGYPEKVDKMLAEMSRETGLPIPKYVHIQDTDLSILKSAAQAGHLVMVTYSKSPTGRYGGQRIAHMVNLVHADDKHFVVLDNNYMPSDRSNPDNYEDMTPEEFSSICQLGGKYWAIVLLKPGCPLPPYNL